MPNRALRLAGVTFVFALLALAATSVGWHDHALWVDELAPRLVAQVEHAGAPDENAHFDAGASEPRAACWACVLSSSPLVASADASAPAPVPAARERFALPPVAAPESRAAAALPARGPPLPLLTAARA